MQEKDDIKKLEKHKNNSIRIKGLAAICFIITLVLIVATYAWFIGMRTVSVAGFDIEIASTESLLLSLNGRTWDTTVSINKENYNYDDPDKGTVYPGHTNSWGGKGLMPLSSIGEMDPTTSRMKLFGKASLTATAGGFRLMTGRIDNSAGEQDGYIVFDLFIKNISGSYYNEELNEADEEAIYLEFESAVTIPEDAVEGTGIENSIRVAFAQVGRVRASVKEQEVLAKISCDPLGSGQISIKDGVTGICRQAVIWEPNDTQHVQNAINWYNATCRKRVKADIFTDKTAYSGEFCNPINNGEYYPTYAVGKVITSNDKVDVFDGLYNGYDNGILTPFDYFTDSEKLQDANERPIFMTLAPNSITKVRIYIYLEGQDIDNYEFASVANRVSVTFGFTKQRYREGDIDYEGPDLTPPIITINGPSVVVINQYDEYIDQGATAVDDRDDILPPHRIVTISDVNTNVPGIYTVTYIARDSAGNESRAIRTVVVKAIDSDEGEGGETEE